MNSEKSGSYIVGTGWWCTNEDLRSKQTERKFLGSDIIRGRHFHHAWYGSLCKNTSPQKIFIVDSSSPVKPDLNADDHRIEIISLPFNAGHSTKHVGKWSGWMRSVLLGLQYAQVADVEYFVYVEQDVLLRGEGIIEHCIKEMRTPYMFGSGIGTPQIIQQSFFIMHRAGINDFVSRLAAIPFRDSELCAEDKFVIATSWTLTHLSGVLARLNRPARQLILRRFANYDLLPVGFGRTRPVDFNNEYFYFQHGTDKELEMYSEAVTGFRT